VLLSDAASLKVREGGWIMSRAAAVGEDSKREVLNAGTGPSEAETFWTEFLRSLADRGARGVNLVIADDHEGPRATAWGAFGATQRRCRVHWTRNALAHAAAEERSAVATMPRTICAHETMADAQAQWDTVADAPRDRQDTPGSVLDASRDDVLAHMD
jgi:transposase-like protein